MEFAIEIVLQPIIDSITHEVVMAEALARPKGMTVAQLIDSLNTSDRMAEFDKFMTEEVGKINVGVPLSVNWGEGCYCEIADHLIIEFTEQMDFNTSKYRALKKSLTDNNVKIMLDDYSTGNASMSVAGEFESIKIPRETVTGEFKLLQEAMKTMQNWGVQELVFEGVEDMDDLRKVCTTNFKGKKMIQGYLIAKPMPINMFEEWKDAWHAAQRVAQA